MKKLGLVAISFCFAIMLSSTAQAIPLTPDSYNGIGFINNEMFVDKTDSPTTVDVGDQFWGVLWANSILGDSSLDGVSGTPIWAPCLTNFCDPSVPEEITGYFSMEVVATPVVDVYDPILDVIVSTQLIIYGPTTDGAGNFATDINGILDPGEVFRIFEDDKNFDSTTNALGLATATDGTHVWSMTTLPDAGVGGNGYFYTIGSTAITIGPVGTSYAGLNYISPFGPLLPGMINDPNEFFRDTLVEIFFNSESSVIQNSVLGGVDGQGNPIAYDPNAWDISSNDPAVLLTPIPEPTSMLLLGTGLVGLVGASRRRRKAAKK